MATWIAITIVAVAIASFYLGWFFREKIGKDKVSKAESYSDELIHSAKQEAEDLKREKLLEVEETVFQKSQAIEEEKNGKLQILSVLNAIYN